MTKAYKAPTVTDYGTVTSITAAIGGNPRPDQSEFAEIEADHGSFDVCINDGGGVC